MLCNMTALISGEMETLGKSPTYFLHVWLGNVKIRPSASDSYIISAGIYSQVVTIFHYSTEKQPI